MDQDAPDGRRGAAGGFDQSWGDAPGLELDLTGLSDLADVPPPSSAPPSAASSTSGLGPYETRPGEYLPPAERIRRAQAMGRPNPYVGGREAPAAVPLAVSAKSFSWNLFFLLLALAFAGPIITVTTYFSSSPYYMSVGWGLTCFFLFGGIASHYYREHRREQRMRATAARMQNIELPTESLGSKIVPALGSLTLVALASLGIGRCQSWYTELNRTPEQEAALKIAADTSVPDVEALAAISAECTKGSLLVRSDVSGSEGALALWLSYEIIEEIDTWDDDSATVRRMLQRDIGKIAQCVAIAGETRGLQTLTIAQFFRTGQVVDPTYAGTLDLAKLEAVRNWRKPVIKTDPNAYLDIVEVMVIQDSGVDKMGFEVTVY